jgi:hypothetical protein
MGATRSPESYVKVFAQTAGLVVVLGLIALRVLAPEPRSAPALSTPEQAETPRPIEVASIPAPTPPPIEAEEPEPEPEPEPPAPKVDEAEVASARTALDLAKRERARSEARAELASKRLAEASRQAASDARAAKTLAFRVRDPSTRIDQASARVAALRTERDTLKKEVVAIAGTPRPKAKVLSNKNPVAKPTDADERHFELRRNRVTPILLDRLMTQVKADANLRIRLSDGKRIVESKVGPAGAFSLRYVLIRSLGVNDLMDRRSLSYDLRAWEVLPEQEGRGESYETSRRPFSEYARVVDGLSPARNSVTFWIYPDSFALFRRLRDDLQSRGFLVAARPLPDGMTIRGSPAGSVSAAQ